MYFCLVFIKGEGVRGRALFLGVVAFGCNLVLSLFGHATVRGLLGRGFVQRVAPLSSGSYFCVTSQRGGRFACPVRYRHRFRLGFIRRTPKIHHMIKSSTRIVNSCSLMLVADPSLRRI